MPERLNPYSIENLLPMPDPRTIVSQTAVLLPLYFSNTLNNEAHALDYFSGPTTNFLTNISRGFILSHGINLTRASKKDLAKLLHIQDDLTTDDPDLTSPRTRAMESFNLTVTIFSQMPELADSKHYTHPLISNKMAVIPPRDGFEFIDRVEELRDFISGITHHEINPVGAEEYRVADWVYRSMAFFQVGKDLPLKQEPTKNQVIEMLQKLHLN